MKKNLYALFLLLISSQLFAGNFTPGNLVVVRVGDGSAALTNASTAVFLDEYTTTGTLVQSVAVPASINGSNHALTLSGKASTEGALTLSPNNQYLSFVGFDTTTGYANVSTGITNRTVALVGSNGTVNTSTGFYAGSAYVTDNFRGAVTLDGTSFWCAGAGSGTSGGTWYLPFGSFTAAGTQINSAVGSVRAINIFGGQLYFTTNSSTTPIPGLFSLGTGEPTSSGQTANMLTDASGDDSVPSPYAFYFCHQGPGTGNNVLYICDDETASPLGGIYKFSLVDGIWLSNGNVPNASGLRGIAATAGCTSVNMFLTAGNGVFTFKDTTGYNQNIAGTFTQIVTATTNTVIRGISFTPGTAVYAALTAGATGINITCHGETNGSVNTTITGGTAPYAYTWSNSSTTQNLANISANTYTITVKDAGGCSATASATITQPLAISASAAATNVVCNGGNNGAVNLTVSGGSGSYTFNWSNGATAQNLITIVSGPYTVTVTDTHSCTATATTTVTQPTAITIVPTVTNLPCSGGAGTGAVNIVVSGGTGADTYAWSNGVTTQNITGLNAGPFTVTVTDASHCTASQTNIVSQSGSMTITTAVTNVLCFGQSNGGITVTASGGTPSYNYAWSTGNNNVPQTGLAAGNYTVTVTDQGGCTLINSIAVSQPPVLSPQANGSNVVCYGDTTGGISLSVTGGKQPYSYLWSNTSTGQNLSSLPAATYTVTVTDSNSCTATASAIVAQPADSISIAAAITNATASGDADGAINLTVTGGTPGYTYSWNTGAGADNTALAAGQYCVTVSDSHGCPASDCFEVTQPTGIAQTELASGFKIYSNGSLLILTAALQSPESCVVMIRDITGRLIYRAEPGVTSLLQMQISTNSFSPGCYIVTLSTTEAAASKKVILSR